MWQFGCYIEGIDLLASSSASFANLQYWLSNIGNAAGHWMNGDTSWNVHQLEKTPVILKGLAKNHLADEWRPLPRRKLLVPHLAKLCSLVTDSCFKCFCFPPGLPPPPAFGFWEQICASWLFLLMLVGGWGGAFLPNFVKSWEYPEQRNVALLFLIHNKAIFCHFFKCSLLM